ncbi:MAG: hypothetical protein K6A43_08570 [Treponema sp.]|nr:hypothetical protein [Treponema sp.]
MKKNPFKITKKNLHFMEAIFLFTCFLFGCSLFSLKEKTGEVVFSVDSNTYAKLVHSDSIQLSEKLFLDVELKGGYSAVKTIPCTENAVAKFDSIPVGTELFVEINAYFENQGEKKIFYSGKSESLIIAEGENQIEVTLKRVEQEPQEEPTEPEVHMTIYISGTGDDSEGDGTQENPFETLDKACEKIIEDGTKDTVWTIYIMGDVTGPHDGTNKAGARQYTKDFGRSIIPSEVTSENAKSIILTGFNGLDANEIPQDKLNRGLQEIAGAGSAYTGTVLVVATEVPVTITNLLLTGSQNDSTNNSDDLYHTKGGGLFVSENSTVTLSDGLLISGNDAKYGGGVYNEGTLYMVGTACIGDKTATSVANGYVKNGKCSNEYSYGGGVYNKGNLYLGYEKYVSETDNVPKELTGGIYYSFGYDAHGGGIYNQNGTTVMNSGTIAYNDGAGQAGGVDVNSGTFIMTGGSIHHNSTGHSGGGVFVNKDAVFVFAGGTINANWATSSGGGVFISGSDGNYGKMFMYGNAVVGDLSKSYAPTSRDGANATDGMGAGIYTSGKLYMGYKSYISDTENEPSELSGGICYNYVTDGSYNSGGGGLYINSPSAGSSANANVRMNSGTIANNSANSGGAIYLSGSSSIILSGTVTIPAGEERKNDIYTQSYPFYIKDSLPNITEKEPIYVTPSSDSGKTRYYNSNVVIKLAENALIETLDAVKDKFVVTPLVATSTGIVTHWVIGSDGKVVQNTINLFVSSEGSDSNDGLSASSALASLQAAMNKMDDSSKDYVVTINGQILGVQTISDYSTNNGKIQANSIKVVGKNTSNNMSYEPKDVFDGNLKDNETGSTLTIDTVVPVTLYGVAIKGGHGTKKNRNLIGGGLLICEGSSVSVEYNTRIFDNSTLVNGNDLSGYGAGVFVSKNAKLFIDTSSLVFNNTSAALGGGIYVSGGGYLRIQKGSTSHINNNQAYLNGGGVYLEDESVMEMYGGYINDNILQSTDAGSTAGPGFGTGIYVSKSANFRISGAATVTIPNDVYLQDNVQIEVTDIVSGTPNARLTPESYPAADLDEELCLIKLNNELLSRTLSWSGVASHFEITPENLSNGQKQYWFVDSSNDGKLSKKNGMELSVALSSGLKNDISVAVTSNGKEISNNTHLSGGSALTFTATTGFKNYFWTFDGEDQRAYTGQNVFEIDTSKLPVGTYVVYLEATDSQGDFYSYTAQIVVAAVIQE